MKTGLIALLLSFVTINPSIYNFKLNDIEGESQINFSQFKGKKLLIVNTACNSPYTFQIEGLQQLYSAYKHKLTVVAIPAGNDFGDQEFKTNGAIRDLFRYTYNVTFPVTEKTTTIGPMRHPIFAYLIDEAKKQGMSEPVIKWNFTKFLLVEEGNLIKVFPADVTPLSTEITSYLNNSKWSLN